MKKQPTKKKNVPMIRKDMVEYYKKQIACGEYSVKSEEIADKMVQKIREQPSGRNGRGMPNARLV